LILLFADTQQDDEPLLAIKQLYSDSEIQFEKERTILTMLDSNGIHPHRITLLATFKYLRKYHLVFRYADANLRKYWKDRPFPSFDKATVHWCLRQMAGLSNSLLSIHDFSVRSMLDEDGKERLHKDTNPSATEPLKRFGRHGDIKAENILYFKQSPGSSNSDDNDDNGTLQLADFGLSRVHRRDSRSNVPWDKILGSPTYEPPELKLHLNVSRAYDIWSLGCLYLDFITWLLEGSDAITSFTQTRRACAATSSASDDESFFSIVGGVPVVRQEVLDWVARLHRHEKCSALIHDLLEIIMRDMLCPKSAQRTDARWVDHLLFMRLKAANEDEDYLLKPVPVQQQTAQDASMQSTSSALMAHGDTPAAKWMSVTFESEEKGLPALENGIKFPKDLLRRNEGTPGQRLTRATTFKT
jgi:serine/threonine protein kinase